MEHISYGLFDDETDARAAADEIDKGSHDIPHCDVVLHKGTLDEGRLSLNETGAAEGVRDGAAIGTVLGAVTGAIALGGPLGLAAVTGGAVFGAVYGAVAGALGGCAGPDRRLEHLEDQLKDGKILVTVEAPSLLCRDQADTAIIAHGGRVQHKPFF